MYQSRCNDLINSRVSRHLHAKNKAQHCSPLFFYYCYYFVPIIQNSSKYNKNLLSTLIFITYSFINNNLIYIFISSYSEALPNSVISSNHCHCGVRPAVLRFSKILSGFLSYYSAHFLRCTNVNPKTFCSASRAQALLKQQLEESHFALVRIPCIIPLH